MAKTIHINSGNFGQDTEIQLENDCIVEVQYKYGGLKFEERKLPFKGACFLSNDTAVSLYKELIKAHNEAKETKEKKIKKYLANNKCEIIQNKCDFFAKKANRCMPIYASTALKFVTFQDAANIVESWKFL
jgi:hypothetical protein